jgi:hypothetical protein
VIERLVARLIEHLDEQDGDPDLEPNGDERDGSAAEDDWHHGSVSGGLSSLPAYECEDAEPSGGVRATHGTDQRIVHQSYGFRPWHIDEERQL